MARTATGSVREEFADAEIADWRLRERLGSLVDDLDQAPGESLPDALKTDAAQEGAYRFLGNPKVTPEKLLGPHIAATVRRCRAAGTVYVVSDTTEFAFSGEERGRKLGRLQGKRRGFLGHFALAVSDVGKPLGVLGMEVIVRGPPRKESVNVYQRKKDPNRESLRWAAMVERTGSLLETDAAIHLMDSEADIYELLTSLQQQQRRFIIRSCQDRLLEEGCLSDAVERAATILTREVKLSSRKPKVQARRSRRNPPRQSRLANLTITSTRVSLKRPKTCTVDYPALLSVNVVRVFETDPPDGEEPVEWILLTSEPVESEADASAVVDGYRRRWQIEEYFKAIKTGCAYEKRQLESERTLSNLLAIVAVLAWRLLLLRALERDNSNRPATDVVEPGLLEALAERLKDIRERKPFPASPTVADLMNGIARLGGHIKNNGPPGWQVLWRGYQDLLIWSSGYLRGRSAAYSDQS